MGSPIFDFEGISDNSRFLDLLSRFQSRGSDDWASYLEPNDPDFVKYRELSAAPTGSEDLISEYVGRRPSFQDYKPSTGRKIASFILGALSGNPAAAYTNAQKVLYDPYERQLTDWKGEGSNIASRARLMDAERQRELTALKYGLQQRSSTIRNKNADVFKTDQEARRLANSVFGEEKFDRTQDRLEEDSDFRRNMANSVFDLRNEMFDWRKKMDEERIRDRDETEARLKAESESRAKEREGNDLEQEIKNQDNAKELAFRQASQNPAFTDLLVEDEDGWNFTDPESERTRILKLYLNGLIAKYMKGGKK